MSVRRAQAEVDAAEFAEWMAYNKLHPFAGEVEYLGFAIVASTVANCMSSGKGKRWKPDDFIPRFDRQQKQSNTEIAATVRSWCQMQQKIHGKKRSNTID